MANPANIARSLTIRMNRKMSDAEGHSIMSRAFSTRKPQERIPIRPEISLPIELLSATNPLAFTAPDIHSQNNPSSATSAGTVRLPYSPAQTLASTASSNSLRSESSVPGLSTTSSVGSPSPLQTPVNEVAEDEFGNSEKRGTLFPSLASDASIAARLQEPSKDEVLVDQDRLSVEAPVVPKRAPSHTKKTHQALHRQRSLSRIGARTPSLGPRSSNGNSINEDEARKSNSSAHSGAHTSTQSMEKDENGVKIVRNSIDIFSSSTHADDNLNKDHPFGAELAKLDEMAEEFSPTKLTHADKIEPKQELRRERSFKALRRGLSRKERKSDTEKKPEAENAAEPKNELQRQRSFKVLRRDPSTKELRADGAAPTPAPKIERAEEPAQRPIPVPRRDPSRRRAPTVTRDDKPVAPTPTMTAASKPKSIRQQPPRPVKVSIAPSEPTIWDEEMQYLSKHGLKTFTAEDYMAEIGSPFASTFASSQAGWM